MMSFAMHHALYVTIDCVLATSFAQVLTIAL